MKQRNIATLPSHRMINSKSRRFGLASLLASCVVFIYWRCLGLPFVEDDWLILHSIVTKGGWTFFRDAMFPTIGAFYRPMGHAVILLLYECFHLDPLGYHVLSLLLQIVGSLLVVLVAFILTENETIAWVCGFLDAGAVTVHMDPALMIVGVYDLLGLCLFLASFNFFLRKRRVISGVFFLCAVLTKEAAIVLPAILLLYSFLIKSNPKGGVRSRAVDSLRDMWPHLIASLGFLAVDFKNIMALSSLPMDSGYAARWLGSHLITNLYEYWEWCCQIFYPLTVLDYTDWFAPLASLVLIILMYVHRRSISFRMMVFFLGWFVIGLVPVLPLLHHGYRYYLTYSLPALSLILATALGITAEQKRLPSLIVSSLAIAVLIILAPSYIVRHNENSVDLTLLSGTANLPLKTQLVTLTREHMQSHYPRLAPQTILVCDGLPSNIFGGSDGPQLWYGDTTLRVYDSWDVEIDSLGVYRVDTLGRHFFDPNKVIVLTFNGDSLHSTPLAAPADQR